jgi:O-succinylbenzoic acid--CoA ligase
MEASARASARRLGGAGRWLLALPTTHIAGLNVVVRSLLAGHDPVLMPPGPFTAAGFLAAWHASGSPRARYVSLVPTQLARLVRAAQPGRPATSPDPAGLRTCLAAFDAILVGGAAADPSLIAAAHDLGIRVVTTYGCAETCGGVVYDGVPLDGIDVELHPSGRIAIAGETLALGYVEAAEPDSTIPTPATHAGSRDSSSPTMREEGAGWSTAGFVTEGGRRWFRTNDLGAFTSAGGLAVLGRADDVIVSGGIKVAPALVEEVLRRHPTIADAVVVGVPDVEWGQRVAALVVPRRDHTGAANPSRGRGRDAPGPVDAPQLPCDQTTRTGWRPADPAGEPLSPANLRAFVAARLDRTAAPHFVLAVAALPMLTSGKVDRAEARRQAAAFADRQPTPRHPVPRRRGGC